MWSDLPRSISGRLHAAGDFAALHGVCKPWRHSHDETRARNETTDQFLPWLLAPNEKDDDSLKLRCVFSDIDYLAPPPPFSVTGRNCVASADGTAVLYFTANPPDGPTLHDPLTGTAVRHLPPFLDGQWREENHSGIFCNDGTVLLYCKYEHYDGDAAEFRAVLLRPGDQEWTIVHRTLESTTTSYCSEFCVGYHNGKILVTVDDKLWNIVTTTSRYNLLVPEPSSMPYLCEHSHVLESRGELLWASVNIRTGYLEDCIRRVADLTLALAVSVHALEEAPNPRWVLKNGASLADRVLFLGWPNSFAVDASRLGMDGGFAYFVYDDCKYCRVFRHNLVDNTTEFIDWLSDGWDDVVMCTWIVPQPTISPLHQGRPAALPRRNNMIHIKRDW